MSEVLRAAGFDSMKKSVGDRIYDQRMLLGLTQEQLAKKAGVRSHVVSYAERGLKDLRVSTYFKLCHALGLAVGLPGLSRK